MPTAAHRDIIKASMPLRDARGEALTTHCYPLLFREHPEMRPYFNPAHRADRRSCPVSMNREPGGLVSNLLREQ